MHSAQRGFLRGRQILGNIIDLEARVFPPPDKPTTLKPSERPSSRGRTERPKDLRDGAMVQYPSKYKTESIMENTRFDRLGRPPLLLLQPPLLSLFLLHQETPPNSA
eukprot:1076013-Amphidinium_carterae.1